LLEHAQQPHLDSCRYVADFVQENRAVLGQGKPPGLVLAGIREGACLVAEELGFDQCVGQRPAVDRNERPSAMGAVVVWMARAISSLPVPLAPSIRTVLPLSATWGSILKILSIRGFLLTMSSKECCCRRALWFPLQLGHQRTGRFFSI
jgi:hypothetical protein